ncbi:PAS domain S-box protein [Thermodesulfobacteriota bacterium]
MRKDERIVFANSRLGGMLGYSWEELENLGRREIYHPDDRERLRERISARLDEQDMPNRYEVRMQRKDGSTFPAELDGRLAVFQGERAAQVWVRDISERIQAEQQRLLLVAAIEQAAEFVFVLDTQARIQYVNPAFEKATGYEREEIIGRNARFLTVREEKDTLTKEVWRTLSNGKVWSGHFKHKRKYAEPFDAETTISTVKGPDDTTSFVAVVRDVTRERVLESQLRQAQKMEAIGNLAAGIAHTTKHKGLPLVPTRQLHRSAADTSS